MTEALVLRRQIGRRLREFRESLGMTQEQFREALGLAKRQTVSCWERGVAMPRGQEWIKLSDLGLSLDYAVKGIRTIPVSSYARSGPSRAVTDSAAVPSP